MKKSLIILINLLVFVSCTNKNTTIERGCYFTTIPCTAINDNIDTNSFGRRITFSKDMWLYMCRHLHQTMPGILYHDYIDTYENRAHPSGYSYIIMPFNYGLKFGQSSTLPEDIEQGEEYRWDGFFFFDSTKTYDTVAYKDVLLTQAIKNEYAVFRTNFTAGKNNDQCIVLVVTDAFKAEYRKYCR